MGENMPDSDSAELVNLVSVTKGKEKVSAQAGVLSDKRQIVCQTVSERARLKEILEKNNELESQLAIQTKVDFMLHHSTVVRMVMSSRILGQF
jgi:transposase-like protein